MIRALSTIILFACWLSCFGASPAGSPTVSVDTIADLVARKPVANERVLVAGWRTPGDWGAQRVIRHDPASVAATNLGCVFGNAGAGRYLSEDCESGEVDVRWFGAVGDGTTDDTAAIQAALDYAEHKIVRLPPGVYIQSGTILIAKNRWLLGAGPTSTFSEAFNPTNTESSYRSGALSWLRLSDGANCPQIQFTTNGATYLRQTTTFYDGDSRKQYYLNSGIGFLGLQGNYANQTTNNCHAIAATDCWNFHIENVTILFPRGFGSVIRNCNVVRIKDCNFTGYPVVSGGLLIDDSADITINNNFLFGAQGPVLWVNQLGGFKNSINGNLIGNSYAETLKTCTFSGADITSSSHGYGSGDIVMFQTTGTLPSPISSNQTCIVVVKDSNTFGIHTNWTQALAGNTLSLAGGSGTLSVYRGRPSGIYFSATAKRCSIVANRVDQCYGHGIYLEGASYVTITGNELSENGTYGNPTANTNLVAAVAIDADSDYNIISSNSGVSNDYGVAILDELSGGNLIVANMFAGTEVNGSVNALAKNRILANSTAGVGSRFVGGSGGAAVLELHRPQTTSVIGLRPGSRSLSVYDETTTTAIARMLSDESTITFTLGGATETPVRNNYFQFAGTTTETNIAGNVQFRAPQGIGTNALGGDFYFYAPETNSTSSLQTNTVRVVIDRNETPSFTPLTLLVDSTLSRVKSSSGVLNVGLTGGDSSKFFRGDGVFTNIVPIAPTNNGAYVLFVTNGVASWIAHP